MIRKMRLQNVKAFADSGVIELRPLTVLLGKNNSGKSTLLQALLALKQTLDTPDSDTAFVATGPYLDLGSFDDILHKGADPDAAFGIRLEADSSLLMNVRRGDETHRGKRPWLDVAFKLDKTANKIVVSYVKLGIGDELISHVARSGTGIRAPAVDSSHRDYVRPSLINFLPHLILGPVPDEAELRTEIMQEFLSWQAQMQGWLRYFDGRVEHVTPVRPVIPRFSIQGEAPDTAVGAGGAALLRALRSDRALPESNRTLLQVIDRWLSQEFGVLERLRLQDLDTLGRIRSLVGDESDGFAGISVASMGSGVSQVLPIIAAVASNPQSGLLLIEQPELHLHPAAQADVAELLVAAAQKGDRQFLVETHSEHLVVRLRRRVAEGAIAPEDVQLLFVERQGRNSNLRPVSIDSSGRVEGWPSGFFDEGYLEAAALARASAKSRAEKAD